MDRLLNIGFINVGLWTIDNGYIKYQLTSHHSTKNILYSFVSNGIIKYIGKTTMSLTKRMYGYQNPGASQITNFRVNKEIADLISLDQPLEIFILVDNGLLKYGDFKINLAAGLEDTLIYQINPVWNFYGKDKIKQDIESEKEELMEKEELTKMFPPINDTFKVKLGPTYYNQGFFNVTRDYSDKLGPDKATIEIQLGDNRNSKIQAYINRTANTNGTPRIMGGVTLARWIQDNFRQDDIVLVDIVTPVSIKLNVPSRSFV